MENGLRLRNVNVNRKQYSQNNSYGLRRNTENRSRIALFMKNSEQTDSEKTKVATILGHITQIKTDLIDEISKILKSTIDSSTKLIKVINSKMLDLVIPYHGFWAVL